MNSRNLSSMLSSLNSLLSLSNHTLSASVSTPPPTLNRNLIQCPFNPHHLMPPHSLFLHHLRCPSSPSPISDADHLLRSLTYPKTLNTPHSHSQLPLSLDPYLDFASNFFYHHCPGVVSLSDSDSINRTFTLPPIFTSQCADFSDNLDSQWVCMPILPSEYWAIAREVQSWNDYPTTYSNAVLCAISGLGIAKERDLMSWIIVNSPRYGVVIDTPMQQHIFLLCCLCFKSILREAFNSLGKQKSQLKCAGVSSECPVLNQALMWLASQVSILYGVPNGKFFVLDFVKNCILVAASGLLLFPLGEKVTEATALEQESQNAGTDSGDIKDLKPDAQHEDKSFFLQNKKIFVSQVAAAVAALHERSMLEHKIKGLWFSQQPSKYQLVSEHCYLTERASEERKKRVDYRPLIDHDGFHQQQSSNQEASKEKTREELLAEERDYKRRRMSYRGKKIKSSAVQVMRDVIEEYMEVIKQDGGVEKDPVNVSEESRMFPSKHPSGHDIPMEANNSRKVNHDSPAVTITNPSYYEKQSHTNYSDKSKADEDTYSRKYEQHRQEHYRSHDYVENQRNTGRGKYHRDHASTSPKRHKSHSRLHEYSIHHKKQDYSSRKKYDHSSRTRDRWQKDTDKNHTSDSSLKNAFSDRYDPSESHDVCDD